jgi:hypothetical protein
MGLFLYLSSGYGFPSREAVCTALHEFRKVEGQKWAEDLLCRFGDPKMQSEVEARA